MLKKSFAILISIALAMGILVHGSFAYVAFGDEVYFTDLLTSLSCPSVISDSIYSKISEFDDPSEFIVLVSSYRDGIPFVQVQLVNLRDKNGTPFEEPVEVTYLWNQPNFVELRFSPSVNITQWRWTPGYNNAWIDGTSASVSTGFTGNNNTYLNATIYISQGTYHNLSFDNIFDNRIMEVYKDEYLIDYLPYLAVRVDDMPYAYMWISVRYHDQYGNGTEIFDIFDLEYYPGDDFQLYLINPLYISADEFSVDSVVYSGSLDWGYKEVDDLNITFNEPVYPDPIPSVTPVPDYNYFDTDIINYNGGQKDIFYNSFQVNIKRFEDLNPSYYFVDDYNYLNQPFSFNYILLPYYPVQQGFLYDEFIDDCFYQYDVILSEYYDAYFDFFYGPGALTSLQTALSSFSSGADISAALESWYSSHSPVVYTYPYFDDSDLFHLSSDMPALLVVTDSFYFKQTNYLLGDTGDILSQFSERFYKVDGFADTLFSNLLSSYNLDLTFYQNTSRALTGLSYWLNDNSLDKLSYLVNIDTDLHDLLEWFQNQEDPDVVLQLPTFNPSALVDQFGLNIGDLVNFFNGFISVLPDFDYTEFLSFFSNADDFLDEVVGDDNSVVNHILDPFEYSDSSLDDFGWEVDVYE